MRMGNTSTSTSTSTSTGIVYYTNINISFQCACVRISNIIDVTRFIINSEVDFQMPYEYKAAKAEAG